MARANRRLTRDARYGKYVDGPDPLAGSRSTCPRRSERSARTSWRATRRARVTGVPAPRRSGPGWARQPGPTSRRTATRRRRHHLDETLQEIRELLDRAVLAERKQLARDVDLDDSDRALREIQLGNLSPSAAAAVSETERLRLAEQRRARRLREDQGSAGPRDARPAVRRHEERPRERDR
ncbi:hypothetical protein [Aeromicrobium sp. UC242_57]|uniref:hypothetical protein n=1 Tax=Aeromicrobium sp. UC242_57 TaxID=3374624 RepID=UPI0037A3AFBA